MASLVKLYSSPFPEQFTRSNERVCSGNLCTETKSGPESNLNDYGLVTDVMAKLMHNVIPFEEQVSQQRSKISSCSRQGTAEVDRWLSPTRHGVCSIMKAMYYIMCNLMNIGG